MDPNFCANCDPDRGNTGERFAPANPHAFVDSRIADRPGSVLSRRMQPVAQSTEFDRADYETKVRAGLASIRALINALRSRKVPSILRAGIDRSVVFRSSKLQTITYRDGALRGEVPIPGRGPCDRGPEGGDFDRNYPPGWCIDPACPPTNLRQGDGTCYVLSLPRPAPVPIDPPDPKRVPAPFPPVIEFGSIVNTIEILIPCHEASLLARKAGKAAVKSAAVEVVHDAATGGIMMGAAAAGIEVGTAGLALYAVAGAIAVVGLAAWWLAESIDEAVEESECSGVIFKITLIGEVPVGLSVRPNHFLK